MKELVSIEERRVSALVVALLGTLLFALGWYLYKGVIDPELVEIIKAEIYATAGVSALNTGISMFSSKSGARANPSDQGGAGPR